MDRFDEFWGHWPNKKAKRHAQKMWVKNNCDEIADKIIDAIPAYMSEVKRLGWLNYAHPGSWIEGHRWEDEYDQPEPEQVSSGTNDFLERRKQMRVVNG